MRLQFQAAVALVGLVCVSGCEPLSSEPVTVQATITEVNEAEGNKVAAFSNGMYQQFYDVRFEITSPDKLAGKWLKAKIETRLLGGSDFRLLSEGTRMEFLINPLKLNRNQPCLVEDLLGYRFLENE